MGRFTEVVKPFMQSFVSRGEKSPYGSKIHRFVWQSYDGKTQRGLGKFLKGEVFLNGNKVILRVKFRKDLSRLRRFLKTLVLVLHSDDKIFCLFWQTLRLIFQVSHPPVVGSQGQLYIPPVAIQ